MVSAQNKHGPLGPTLAFKNGFPNSVARDGRLSPAALVLLAYRFTFADERSGFALNEKALTNRPIVKPNTGLGKNNIRAALALTKRLGY